MLARFRDTIPTVKSVSSSKIQIINFGFFDRNYDFALFEKIVFSRVLHVKHSVIFHINNAILYEILCVMHEMRRIMLTTRVLTDFLTPATPSVKISHWRFTQRLNPLDNSPMFIQFYQIPCVFVGGEFPGSYHRLRTPSDTFANFHH